MDHANKELTKAQASGDLEASQTAQKRLQDLLDAKEEHYNPEACEGLRLSSRHHRSGGWTRSRRRALPVRGRTTTPAAAYEQPRALNTTRNKP